MLVAMIKVSGVRAEVMSCTDIPAGLAGGQIQIEYDDSVWSGLRKTVVFKGYTTVDIITDAATIVIPPEVVSRQHVRLSVGILGTSPDGTEVIPTLWADLGIVKPATDPSGDSAADPQLPIWAQLLHMIGDLNGLGTNEKDNLVAAVNELLKTSGGSGGITPDAVKRLIAEHSEIDIQSHPDIRVRLDALDQRFGDLERLETEDKSSLVAAVNEVLGKAGTGGSGGNTDCLLTIETITIGEPSEPGNVPVTGIILDYSTISLTEGENMMLAASVSPSNATNNAVLWKSSNTNIATVDNGYVTAIAEGNAVITAYSAENSSIKATCSVAVEATESGGDEPGGETGEKVYLKDIEPVNTGYILKNDGTEFTSNNGRYFRLPYTEGMQICTVFNSGFTITVYPPIRVVDGENSVIVEASFTAVSGTYGTYEATLTGFSSSAVVYVNAVTFGTAQLDLAYYIPGGAE